MRKEEFLKELEYLLQDISDEDKEEALSYYRDYLEEAGPEKEEAAIEEFGSPERVAAIVRADVTGNLEDGGSFTETGYEDERFRDPNYQVARRLDLPDEKEKEKIFHEETYHQTYNHNFSGEGQEKSGLGGQFKEKYRRSREVKEEKPWTSGPLKIILWIILLLMASPFILGIGGTVIAAVTVVLSVIFAVIIGVLGLTVAAVLAGVVLAVYGAVFMASSVWDGMLLLGAGVAALGCGLLGIVLVIAAAGICIPFCFRSIGKMIDWIGRRLGGKNHERVH